MSRLPARRVGKYSVTWERIFNYYRRTCKYTHYRLTVLSSTTTSSKQYLYAFTADSGLPYHHSVSTRAKTAPRFDQSSLRFRRLNSCHSEYLLRILQVKKIPFTSYDLASDETAKKLWKRKAPLGEFCLARN